MSDEWRSRVHGLLVQPPDRALLIRSEQGWSLPYVEVDTFSDDDLGAVRRAFEDLLGTPVAILRYVARRLDREQKLLEVVDVLEPLDADPGLPAGAEWVDRVRLSKLSLEHEEHRAILERVLEESATDRVPVERPPWARSGWLAEATAWIDESLATVGTPRTGRVEQIRAWSLSNLLRVPTASGSVFFKATAASPLFVDEGTVMRALAELFPDNVPAPLAVDAARRWMLIADLGAELGWDAPIEIRKDVLRVFADMQIESARHAEELIALGCVDRRLDVLAAEVKDLIADATALTELDAEEAEKLQTIGSTIGARCAALVASGLPNTVLHGDLHLSNVARVDGRYVFFDWTDASVGHPFFDLIDVFREEDEAVRDALRDVYLSAWVGVASPDRLLAAWNLAQPLAFLHHAVSYRHIAANVERGSDQELAWALPSFLRKAIAAEAAAEV